jgi:hypothetical protein
MIRYKILVLTIGLFYSLYSIGCDVCGCGGAANYFGVIPNFSKNLVGLRYQTQHYDYLNNEFNQNQGSIVEEDIFNRSELWFRLYPKKRIQTLIFIPFQYHQRIESDRTTNIYGVGDINLYTHYTIINFGDSLSKKHKHTWLIGGGVKLPTAKYQQRDETKAMLPEMFQIGSGTYGFTVQNIYAYRFKSLGVNTDVQYRYNLENELGFKIGNQYSASATFYYWQKFSKFSLLPSLGVLVEQIDANQYFGENRLETGGASLMASFGLDIYRNKFVYQLIGYTILNQTLRAAMPQSSWRVGLGVAYFFKNKK